jgi:formylglycine-generating enzyme required for sulfatase activity/dienelactone hydrolase
MTLSTGTRLGPYEILAAIGAGGMGEVYKATDTRLGRPVAIKVLPAELASDPERLRRFEQEARAVAALDHPNILAIHDIGTRDAGAPYIVTELLEGETLRERLAGQGLTVRKAVDVSIQIAKGLAAAHEKGIVHRDLKPANVFITTDAHVKILDFGIAKLVAPASPEELARATTVADATGAGIALGTVGYMSPEQVRGQAVDHRSDIFSFGCVLYEMLSGKRAFSAETAADIITAILTKDSPPLTGPGSDVPAALQAIVNRCLEKRADDRFQSARDLGFALQAEAEALLVPPLAKTAERFPAATITRAPSQPRFTRLLVAGAIALALLAAAAIVWSRIEESRVHWARETAVAEIARLQHQGEIVGAYLVARRGLQIAPDDQQLRQLWANLTVEGAITSEPSGATVAFRDYRAGNSAWVELGTTPLENASVPSTLLHWRITKTGYEPLDVARGVDTLVPFRLVRIGTAPPGMVFVPQGEFTLESNNQVVQLPDYWLDRHEVTNRQFKAFIDAGGYKRREYWKERFVKDGRDLTWDEAMTEFRDATGRPGPSTWELGTYSDGQDDYPVSGVSWYEAAAYTAFAGKHLPTVYHWYNASGAFGIFSDILEVSNFSGRGPARVETSGSLGPYGTFDMAGNVKEWCWNATGDRRYVLGGSWKDASYQFQDEDAQLPFERRTGFGFRCMLQREPIAPTLTASIKTLARDPATLKPVGNDVFEVYRRLYDYDRSPLEARVEETDNGNPAWRRERVTVRAAYGNERLPVYLYLPKTSRPPYQVLVFFPGSNAVMSRSSRHLDLLLVDFLVRSGRALVYPVYQGTYERHISGPPGPNVLRDVLIERGKDIRRTIDYLETRGDIDASRVAFYGVSLGAQLGPVYLAIEPRFRTGVLFSGGFETWDIPPEGDPVNFAPRVRTPVLMVNGRQDFDLPYETAQVPLFRMLGTPDAEKRHVVLDGGHIPARMDEPIRVILDWLDKYLGPVQ